MTRLLIVEDDQDLARALRINFHARGYDVAVAGDGATALAEASRQQVDLVVLDLGLPDMDGRDVLAGIRGWSRVPVVVLSARDEQRDKVDTLDIGADDYLTKPFGMDELMARIRAALRRVTPDDETRIVRTDAFTIDLAAKTAIGPAGVAVRLTPTEWHLLELLVRNPGRLVPRKQLLADVWGPGYVTETNYLRVYMAQLRRKLERDPSQPQHLITEPGIGYRFDP